VIQAVKSILVIVSGLFPIVGSLVRRRAWTWSTSAVGPLTPNSTEESTSKIRDARQRPTSQKY